MIEAVLDTNMLISHLAGRVRLPLEARSFAVSSLTVFECLRYPGMLDVEEKNLLDLLSLFEIVFVSEGIARLAAKVARTKSTQKPIDLLIAATAIDLDVPLITKNTKDFRGMKGLTVTDRI